MLQHDQTKEATQQPTKKRRIGALSRSVMMMAGLIFGQSVTTYASDGPKNDRLAANPRRAATTAISHKMENAFGEIVHLETGKDWVRGQDPKLDMVYDTTSYVPDLLKNIHTASGDLSDRQVFGNLMNGNSDDADNLKEEAFQKFKKDVAPDTVESIKIKSPFKDMPLETIQTAIKENDKQIVSSKFGFRHWKILPGFLRKKKTHSENHHGTDIRKPVGTPVLTTFGEGGTVLFAGRSQQGIGMVRVLSADKKIIETTHHIKSEVKANTVLEDNQEIGKIYNTDAFSTGPHAHKEYAWAVTKPDGSIVPGELINSTEMLKNGGLVVTKESDLAKELGKSQTKKILAADSYEEFAANASALEAKKVDAYAAANLPVDAEFKASNLKFIMMGIEGGGKPVYSKTKKGQLIRTTYGLQQLVKTKEDPLLGKKQVAKRLQRKFIDPVVTDEMSRGMYTLVSQAAIHMDPSSPALKRIIKQAGNDEQKFLGLYTNTINNIADNKIAKAEAREARAKTKKAKENAENTKLYWTRIKHSWTGEDGRVDQIKDRLVAVNSGEHDSKPASRKKERFVQKEKVEYAMLDQKITENAFDLFEAQKGQRQVQANQKLEQMQNNAIMLQLEQGNEVTNPHIQSTTEEHLANANGKSTRDKFKSQKDMFILPREELIRRMKPAVTLSFAA